MDSQIQVMLKDSINTLVKEEKRTLVNEQEEYSVSISVSKRQISISVYTLKKSPLFPIPMIDKEYATAIYDLRNHMYTKETNAAILKDSVSRIKMLYKTGELSLDTK